MTTAPDATITVAATASTPGAIGILQIIGSDAVRILQALTGVADWPVGRLRLTDFEDIDTGLAGRVTDDVVQLMPHGGVRVMQRLIARLTDLGAPLDHGDDADPHAIYPEASDSIEALVLATIARAASPRAVDLLLAQRSRWRARPRLAREDVERSTRLDRLIDPPRVILCGLPNVGKSTLSNVLLGRSMSIAADLPGTTRDYVTGRLEVDGVVVSWLDTPGLHDTADPIERQAITTARRLMTDADLLIALTDADHDWPRLPREADVRVTSKSDQTRRDDGDLAVSAVTGEGLDDLVHVVRRRLVPDEDLAHPGPWRFDARLDRL